MSEWAPVDGYTVESIKTVVKLVLSARDGEGEEYVFEQEDAFKLGLALIKASQEALKAVPNG